MGMHSKLSAVLVWSGILVGSSQVLGQASEAYDYYEYYDVGYDGRPDDDWFFDHYVFDPAAFDGEYDLYTDYDLGRDLFSCEERHAQQRPIVHPQRPPQDGSAPVAPEAPAQVPVAMKAPRITETSEEAYLRTHKLRPVSGTILNIKRVALKGTQTHHTVVMLATSQGDRRLPVDLGPTQPLQSLRLRKGDKLAAHGVVVRLRDKQVLAATRASKGQEVVEIQRPTQRAQLAALVLGRNAIDAGERKSEQDSAIEVDAYDDGYEDVHAHQEDAYEVEYDDAHFHENALGDEDTRQDEDEGALRPDPMPYGAPRHGAPR
jgi:hypothetical protein